MELRLFQIFFYTCPDHIFIVFVFSVAQKIEAVYVFISSMKVSYNFPLERENFIDSALDKNLGTLALVSSKIASSLESHGGSSIISCIRYKVRLKSLNSKNVLAALQNGISAPSL